MNWTSHILFTDEYPGLRIESFAVINLRGISTNESIIYDACDVILSVYPHRVSLKNMPGNGGNRTYDLWNTSTMLCQLIYAVRLVRVCDISGQNLVPSISIRTVERSHRGQEYFSSLPDVEYTQSNITSIIFNWVHYTNTEKIMITRLHWYRRN